MRVDAYLSQGPLKCDTVGRILTQQESRHLAATIMFVTLYVLYRVLVYIIEQLWSLASALSLIFPFRLTVGLVNKGVFITITYHPMTGRHVVVNIATYACVLIVLLHAARVVLVGKNVPARHAQFNYSSLKQTNETIKAAQKGIEMAKEDFKAMEGTSAVPIEAFLEFKKVGENARELYVALEEMLDVLNQHVN